MIGTWGNAKIDVGTITDANVQYLRDTDLGKPTDASKDTYRIGRSPAKGAIATMELIVLANQGDGYSSGSQQSATGIMTSNNEVGVPQNLLNSATAGQNDQIIFAATGGTGTGATFTGTTIYNIGSLVANLPFSFGSETTTTTTTQDGTTGALTGVAANGANGRFIVTAVNGIVTKVIQEALLPAGVDMQGNGYIIGEPISISKAAMDADGSLGVVGGLITFYPTIDHVTNGAHLIKVLNGGSGYTVGDTVRLNQISPAQKGFPVNSKLATVDVKTLDVGDVLSTAPNSRYPTGILNTSGATGVIAVMDLDGNTTILGAMLPGVPRKFTFQQVLGAGSTVERGLITILY